MSYAPRQQNSLLRARSIINEKTVSPIFGSERRAICVVRRIGARRPSPRINDAFKRIPHSSARVRYRTVVVAKLCLNADRPIEDRPVICAHYRHEVGRCRYRLRSDQHGKAFAYESHRGRYRNAGAAGIPSGRGLPFLPKLLFYSTTA